MRDTGGDVARGELMRLFAEAAWYPTALLPSQGVHWEPVDDRSAKATLIDGAVSLTTLFRFGDDDLIESAQAEARGRTVGGQFIPTPWEGPFSNYQERSGMYVPLSGEVAWLLPEGRRPYWRADHEARLRLRAVWCRAGEMTAILPPSLTVSSDSSRHHEGERWTHPQPPRWTA